MTKPGVFATFCKTLTGLQVTRFQQGYTICCLAVVWLQTILNHIYFATTLRAHGEMSREQVEGEFIHLIRAAAGPPARSDSIFYFFFPPPILEPPEIEWNETATLLLMLASSHQFLPGFLCGERDGAGGPVLFLVTSLGGASLQPFPCFVRMVAEQGKHIIIVPWVTTF